MAKRLSVKHRARRKDQATAYAADKAPVGLAAHKIAAARSRKALLKKAYVMN